MNSQGLLGWLSENILPLGLFIIGAGLIFGARKVQWSEVMRTSTIVIIGLVIIGAGGGLIAFGDELAAIVFS